MENVTVCVLQTRKLNLPGNMMYQTTYHSSVPELTVGSWDPTGLTELQCVHHGTLIKYVDLDVVTYVCNVSTWESLSLEPYGSV